MVHDPLDSRRPENMENFVYYTSRYNYDTFNTNVVACLIDKTEEEHSFKCLEILAAPVAVETQQLILVKYMSLENSLILLPRFILLNKNVSLFASNSFGVRMLPHIFEGRYK